MLSTIELYFVYVDDNYFTVNILMNAGSHYFRIDLCAEEGGDSVELVPGGRDIQVNETNVYDYVRLYANYRMIKTQEKALEVITNKNFQQKKNTKLQYSL